MKYRAFLAATAILSSSAFSPAFADTVTPPVADAANSTTLDAMQDQCDALAAAHDTDNGDVWTGEVVPGDVTLVSGPTEVADSRVIDESSIQGTGTFVPSVLEIRGDPFKNGGSVNLFGEQWATAGYYPDSTYNFSADFDSTFAHAFTCNIYQAVFHAGDPLAGHYVVDPDANGDEEAHTNECNAYNTNGSDLPHPGYWGSSPQGNCIFVPESDPGGTDNPVLIGNETNTTPVNQDQTDTLDGFEDHGGPVEVTGEYFVGDTVICISPSTTTKKGVPGAWVAKNGYDGGSLTGPAPGCNTPYFKIAPTGHGTTTSQGTFISVPDYNL